MKKKTEADKPQHFRHMGIVKHPHFLELHEVDWDNLEEWWHFSLPTQNIRILAYERHRPRPNPWNFIERARHHTTKGRTKSERMMDRYWFVPEDDSTSYLENANSSAIAPRRAVIYAPFIPKGRPEPKAPEERTCQNCGGPFDAKRNDAKFCSPKCQKAAKRAACPR